MKIWLLSTDDPAVSSGGIARYLDLFASEATRQGHEVTVICPGDPDLTTDLSYRVERFEIRKGRRPKKKINEPDEHPAWPYNNMARPAALSHHFWEIVAKKIKEEGAPDWIECQDYQAIAYFILQNKWTDPGFLKGVPVTIFLHTPDFVVQHWNEYPRFRLPDYWTSQLERACMHLADGLVAPSQFIVDKLKEDYDCPTDNAKVIPLPGPPLGGMANKVSREKNLLFLGRVELRKGIEPLLEVCAKLWSEGEIFNLDIVGGGIPLPTKSNDPVRYYKNKYSKWVDAGCLVFHDSLSRDAVKQKLAESYGLVLPSLWENFPYVNLEAMALGKPILASQNGGQAEIHDDGKTGLLFDPQDRKGFTTKLKQFLKLPQPDRFAMGEAARSKVGEFCDPEKIFSERLKHYNSILEAGDTCKADCYPFLTERLRKNPCLAEPFSGNAVTAVIPFYNLGKYLEECVDSILDSREVEISVLIVNDGSTDPASLKVLDKVRGRKDSRIKVLDIENGGLANARNVGAENAATDIIAFVDADDCVEPTFFKSGLTAFRAYRNVHIVNAWTRYFGQGRGVWHSWNLEFPYLLCHNEMIPICMVRRESFLRFGQNKPHIVYGLEDYEGWISMLENGCGGISIPHPLVRYRIRENSMFQVILLEKQLYLYDLIAQEHEQLMRDYGYELYQLQNANGPAHIWDQPTMFRAPIDRLTNKLEEVQQKLDQLEVDYKRVKEAEAWHIKEREKYLGD